MATDIPIIPAAQVAAPGVLPTVSDVKEWTQKELLSFIQSQNILWTGENRKTFEKAEITGDIFLTHGNTLHFWHSVCGLPAGPCTRLVRLVGKVKGIGEEQSQGIIFLCCSDVGTLSNLPMKRQRKYQRSGTISGC
jgi:hypothetical protein